MANQTRKNIKKINFDLLNKELILVMLNSK
jgi:hypothetical protein